MVSCFTHASRSLHLPSILPSVAAACLKTPYFSWRDTVGIVHRGKSRFFPRNDRTGDCSAPASFYDTLSKYSITTGLMDSDIGKIGNISHPGHVEIFRSHRKFASFFITL